MNAPDPMLPFWRCLLAAIILSLFAAVFTSPRIFGFTKSAKLTNIVGVAGHRYDARLPKGLKPRLDRRFLPPDLPALLEDGKPLPKPRVTTGKIEEFGMGRFAVINKRVSLSSSDNSPIDKNHREYVIIVSGFQCYPWVLLLLWISALGAWALVVYHAVVSRVFTRLNASIKGLLQPDGGVMSESSLYHGVDGPERRRPKTPSLMERLCQYLVPWPFFSGIVLGVLICAVLGHRAGQEDIFRDRSRFLFKISPEGYVYPTVENLCQYVRGKAPRDKILVLVGGSSVPLGVGQPNSALWTELLQERLGDAFKVVNLGFRAAKYTSVLLPVAEALSGEYRKMILVSDTIPEDNPGWLQFNETSYSYPYDYVVWQSWIGGDLSPNGARKGELLASLTSPKEKIRNHSAEEAIHAVMERLTASSNLWNLVGYRHVFTIYSGLLRPHTPFWTPRRLIPDDEMKYEELEPVPDRFEKDMAGGLAMLRGLYVDHAVPDGGAYSFRPVPSIERLSSRVPDAGLRGRMLFLVTSKSAYFVDQLTPEERRRYDFAISEWVKTLGRAGYRSMSLGLDYKAEDYVDISHFSEKAAPKMADDVMRGILEIAGQHGWLSGRDQ